ncbi:exonuclease [Sodiomyces alkalinus F11]|uniref:PAN2-PAN3 deadenylation complex catalytic subunit PAN2 n=1 Tax=Sodiomyces alkalinus (strain CBS 110278 / VKM F-3762 / F11) TaxID=1314773 RepID=A0A3N2Q7A4_SODAK|nr:exonuclease [Sodiomyces alkalinus F11]ROT42505.1 exonuclease [Sodiomyces alkalinus F11]
MDGDWDQVARIPFPPPGVRAMATPVTTLAFDPHQELLWTGNDYGRVMSFYGAELQRYTSFKACTTHGDLKQILVNDKGVIVLGSRDIHMASRRGPPIWHIQHEAMKDLQCMSFTSKSQTEILVAGYQEKMFVIDVSKGEITKEISTAHSYKIMKKSRYICAATKDGLIDMIDPATLSIVRSWKAHSALISDMDAQHDFIVTCGFSLRHTQSYVPDPFLNVFDIKRMTPMPPIPFPAGGAFVRMHPRMSTTSIIMSQTGQMHVVDLMNPHTSNVRQVNVVSSLVTMFEIAFSGEAIAIADSASQIHLWGSPSKMRFVDFAQPCEFATADVPLPAIEWTSETPLNSIGMPHYREVLLSAWPDMVSDVGAPPPTLDPQFLATLKATDFGLYGPNTRGLRRNQVEDTRKADKATVVGIQAPKFLSEKARESAKAAGNTTGFDDGVDDVADTLAKLAEADRKSDCPPMYRNVEIRYSKFGVDDFDFGFYNKTPYSGLEIHIANSYANSLLQVMHFTPLIRNLALKHTATSCISEDCLLCEMGFLFDMLKKAEGSICQATNLLKTLSQQPQAANLGLLEEDLNSASLPAMLQRLARFLLDRIVDNFRLQSTGPNLMQQAVQTSATEFIRCMNCRSEYTRPGPCNVTELIYPAAKPPLRNQKATRVTFSQVLKLSVERELPSKGWCPQCQRYQPNASRKTITTAPAVFMINTAIKTPEHRGLWAAPGFLPEEIGVIVDHGQFFCYEGEDLDLHLQRGIHNVTVYSLVGMALDIESTSGQKSHLVGMVNVAHSQPEPPKSSQWHLFNDFLVRPVSMNEALSFDENWKMPTVISYQIREANNKMDTSWKENIDTSLLYRDSGITPIHKTYRTLDHTSETPGPSTIVALDTEFVAIRQPEIEMNSEGERETIRPKVYALARVSLVRGSGENEGEPFVDDYISIREPIVDYLTAFSGITAEDLNPRLSKHHLVPLKVAYKKIWILVNLGCKFLGHGLKQDFRVMNIHIPRSQVIDTIQLYYLHTRLRKLSLAFLAWVVLRENIQKETHDSIEDSRTALRLYRKYQGFLGAGVWEQTLHDIYNTGKDVGFRPPKRDGEDIRRTETPPLPIEGGPGPTTPARRPPVSGGAFLTPGRGSPFS